jgi:uncharacterized protein YjdB
MKTNKFLLLQACMMLFSFSAISQTTIYQAENKTAGQNTTVASSNVGFKGTGYVEMTNVSGNYFEWNNVAATTATTATIRFRYTNSDSSQRARSCDIYVNGTNGDSYIFPWVNGGWAAWTYSAQVMTVNLNAGNNTIRVQINSASASSPKVDEMEVVISAPVVVNVTSVKIDPSNFALFVGQSATLKTIVLPSNATDKSVSWLSSNTNVVTVEAATGVVAGIASGTANVTATTTDGGIVGICTVRVFPLNASVESPNLILNAGFENANPISWWTSWENFTSITSPVATGVNAATVANGLVGGFGQDVTIPAGDVGKTFLFSVKVKTANIPSSAQVGCKVFEGATELNSPYYVTSTDAVYTTYNWMVATTAATTKVQAWVYKTAEGTIYVDDFYFGLISVPTAPTIGTATAGNGQASVAFTAASSNGGFPITSYTITSNSGNHTVTGASSPITVTGLTNSTAYTFSVTATNSVGTGTASNASNSVTPDATANVIPVSTATSATSLSLTAVSDVIVNNGGTLTVNESKTINNVTLEAGAKLNVSSGFPLELSTLTLKAGKDGSTFSSKLDAGITATTVRLFKTIDDTKWYFMSFPCDVTIAQITKSDGSSLGTLGTGGDWFIKYYDGQNRASYGAGSNWKHIALALDPTKLLANQGYIFGLKTGNVTYDVELSIPLNPNILLTETDNRTVPVSAFTGLAASNNFGWNLVGQPYISNFNGNGKTTAAFMSFPDGNNTTYTQVSNAQNSSITPMSAYFVQVTNTTPITFRLTGRQGAKSEVENDLSDRVQLNFISATGTDYTNLIMDNAQSTAYQIGQDLEKMIGTGTDKPQVYSILNDINYAFNALPMANVVNLPIGIYTKTAGTTTINADASQALSLSKLLLTDNSTNPATVTNLLTSNYSFTATAGIDNGRFVITAQNAPTDNIIPDADDAPEMSIVNRKLSINNISGSTTVRVFDALGRMVNSKLLNNNSLDIKLPTIGIYMIQIETGNKNWTRKIVVN